MTRAEELRILVAAYTRQLEYLSATIWMPPTFNTTSSQPLVTAAADTTELPKTPLMLAEDAVSLFLNGGTCTKHTHDGASLVEKLVMFKMLRMEFPHISTSLAALELEIRKALKEKP